MESQVKLVGWLYIILGILGIATAACIFSLLFGIGMISGDQTAITVLSIIGLVTAGIMALLAIPGIISGIGLLKYRNWARALGIILAVLNLFNFPVGTAVGLYALIVLLNDESSALFLEGRSLATN